MVDYFRSDNITGATFYLRFALVEVENDFERPRLSAAARQFLKFDEEGDVALTAVEEYDQSTPAQEETTETPSEPAEVDAEQASVADSDVEEQVQDGQSLITDANRARLYSKLGLLCMCCATASRPYDGLKPIDRASSQENLGQVTSTD